MRAAIRRVTTRGFRRSLRTLRGEWTTMRAHRRALRDARTYHRSRGLRLHLGCGPNLKEGWVNIDPGYPAADLTLDLREPLPFKDRSCEFVYSEHFLEHLGYPHEVGSLLAECFRVLEPGGRFSAGVPDTEAPLLAYARQEEGWLHRVKEIHPPVCMTFMDHINFHFRQGDEHRMAYDEETLVRLLEGAGFADARRRTYDPDLDTERRRDSLFVDARRPLAGG